VNYRHLEVFFAVMTNGTVTEAARQLGVSQPSVTTTLKQAEAKLGIQLFQREGGRLIPTSEARILYEEAERAHEALTAIRTLARRLQVGSGGHVRVAAVPTMSLELLPDAIEIFQKRHKGFSYSVSTLNTEEIVDQLDTRKGMPSAKNRL
jgi:DNA-binding transcriptional LysR family regulator